MSRAFVSENSAVGAGHWTSSEAARKAEVARQFEPDYKFELVPTRDGYRIAKQDDSGNFVAWVEGE